LKAVNFQIIESSNFQIVGTFSFPKSERLYKKKDIQELFDKGSSFYLYPFRVIVQKQPTQDTNQVLFSVSKKNFKRAVDRNLIKRRMREAYRLNKAALPETSKLQMAYIYTAKDILLFDQIRDKMVATFKRLGENEKK
jgi:ribonuclease P protein component